LSGLFGLPINGFGLGKSGDFHHKTKCSNLA